VYDTIYERLRPYTESITADLGIYQGCIRKQWFRCRKWFSKKNRKFWQHYLLYLVTGTRSSFWINWESKLDRSIQIQSKWCSISSETKNEQTFFYILKYPGQSGGIGSCRIWIFLSNPTNTVSDPIGFLWKMSDSDEIRHGSDRKRSDLPVGSLALGEENIFFKSRIISSQNFFETENTNMHKQITINIDEHVKNVNKKLQ
jgi:hypothetical protein